VILHETGLRPDELHRLSWEDVGFDGTNYRYGMFSVRYGKTAAARRILPMSPQVRCILNARHVSAGSPSTGFVFPAPTKSGHLEDSGLRKAHRKALSQSKVAPFLLYSLRHTFATRIASRVDAWTLCKVMGWASLSVAMRYSHPDEKRVRAAFGQQPELDLKSLSGSNSSSNEPQASSDTLAVALASPVTANA